MPIGADEVVTQGHVRSFIQLGGPRPSNPLQYYGVDFQYMFLSGATVPYGDINPINVPDPFRTKGYRQIGQSRDAPDLPEAQLMLYQKHGIVPRELGRQNCQHNLYLVAGYCRDLSDPVSGWQDYVQVYSRATATQLDMGDQMAVDSDDPVTDTYDLRLADIYRLGQIQLGEQATAQVAREVVDLVWGGGVQCGGCGPADDGARRLYAITRASGAGSPGLPAEVVYLKRNKDGSTVVQEYAITGMGANVDPTAIDIMGQYLIVVAKSENAYYFATINQITGALSAFTKVTTGFVASNTPNDIFVVSASRAYLPADNGYLYVLTNPVSGVSVANAGAATTQHLSRIHGDGNATLAAVGNNATVVFSYDGGTTWAVAPSAPGGVNLTAVCVKDPFHSWAGNAAGGVYYTEDQGNSWTAQAITGAVGIQDIVFANDEVGYILYQGADQAAIRATFCAGAVWADSLSSNSRIGPVPSTDARYNRLAVPRTTVDVNTANLAIAGLDTSGANGDGVLIVGATPTL